MELSQTNAKALLFGLNQDIEEYSETTVKNIIEERNFDELAYPPNCGLTVLEKAELSKLDNNEHLKSALRKVLADNSAGVVFNLLNLLDGTASPKYYYDSWTGIKLIDEETHEATEPFNETLHDCFFQTYWEWRDVRGDKGWKLDAFDG